MYKRQHVDSYKEDFDIDKRIIRRAAESPNPEEKTLMWFCRPHGTHCLNENQVFIQGTRDHNTFRFYAEQTYDAVSYTHLDVYKRQDTLARICETLNCEITDVIELVPDEPASTCLLYTSSRYE